MNPSYLLALKNISHKAKARRTCGKGSTTNYLLDVLMDVPHNGCQNDRLGNNSVTWEQGQYEMVKLN